MNNMLQLSAIMQDSDDAIISMTLEGMITSWNRGAQKMYGFTEKEILGQHVSVLIPPYRADEEETLLNTIKKGRKIDHFETTRISKEGREIPVSLTISPIKDLSGEIIGASKIARDITIHIEAVEKQAWLAAIVNSSNDAIVSKTLNGIITSWNKAAQRMFGYTEKEVLGKHISIIIPSDRLKEEDHIIKRIRSGRKVSHFETIRIAKDGRELNISLTVSPVKRSDGTIMGASKIIRDITEEVKIREKLKQYSTQLEQINSYKDNFIGIASHELKTPLTSISGYLQLLDRNLEKAQNKVFLKKAVLQVTKLTTLVSDLLDISRIQSGKLSLNFTEFEPNEMLKEVTDSVQQTTSSHRLELNLGANLKIKADRQRLEQVFTNLLTNSIKYSPRADRVIIKSINAGTFFEISVQDFGIGIPPDAKEKIFNRFYRAEGLSPSYSGLGLGLYISQEIVIRHGGKLWVESEEGKGSVFYCRIPVSH